MVKLNERLWHLRINKHTNKQRIVNLVFVFLYFSTENKKGISIDLEKCEKKKHRNVNCINLNKTKDEQKMGKFFRVF